MCSLSFTCLSSSRIHAHTQRLLPLLNRISKLLGWMDGWMALPGAGGPDKHPSIAASPPAGTSSRLSGAAKASFDRSYRPSRLAPGDAHKCDNHQPKAHPSSYLSLPVSSSQPLDHGHAWMTETQRRDGGRQGCRMGREGHAHLAGATSVAPASRPGAVVGSGIR